MRIRGSKNGKKIAGLFLLMILASQVIYSFAQNPKIYWSFEKTDNQGTQEVISGKFDTLEGFFMEAPGITGKGLWKSFMNGTGANGT